MSIDTTGLTSHDISEGSETPGILGLFGSTIASMIALVHVDILQLFSGPPEVFVVTCFGGVYGAWINHRWRI